MMKLTRNAEVAVQILALCARVPAHATVNTRMASEFAGSTKDQAAQVVSRLTRAGYLVATRGRAGGIRLAMKPSAINVGDVLRNIQPSFGEAAAGSRSGGAGPLDVLVGAATESFVATFDSFTIADLVGDPSTGRIACLDCDLHSLLRRGRALSRSRQSARRGVSTKNEAVRAA